RDSLEKRGGLPIVTARGAPILLRYAAAGSIADGAPMIRSENARLSGYVSVDSRGVDLKTAVGAMQGAVAQPVALPPGYS
ncbi:hypothetical protein AAHH80_38440, partial [Burkholderia pseudomallei]